MTHAHFDELATSWAGHLSINDGEVVIGSLVNPSECQQFTNLCRLTVVVPAPSPGSNKHSTFHSAQHGFGDDLNASWIQCKVRVQTGLRTSSAPSFSPLLPLAQQAQ